MFDIIFQKMSTATENTTNTTSGKNILAHFDIEADGPSPAYNSMLSIGVVFTDSEGNFVQEFLGDFEPLEGHEEDEATMKEFWDRDENNRNELQRIRDNARPVVEVMTELNELVKNLGARRVTWVARPSAYDWQWLNYYQNVYLHEGGTLSLTGNPKRQAFKATDASTMRDIYQAQWNLDRKAMDARCKEWTESFDFNMTHNPLDDARYQSVVYHEIFKALSENKSDEAERQSKCPIDYWSWLGNGSIFAAGLLIGSRMF